MTTCSQTSPRILSSVGCFIYDFQTLLTGIGVAVAAGMPPGTTAHAIVH